MNRSLNIIGFFSLFLAISVGILIFIIPHLDMADGEAVTADLTETDFIVDQSDGMFSASFEPDLTISNSAKNEKKVHITMTTPVGENTDETKNVYPHIFTARTRKSSSDQGMFYEVTIEPESELTLYVQIGVNFSAFTDDYAFDVKVDNRNDKEEVTFPCTVEVTEFNDIKIEFHGDEDEKTITAGRQSIIAIKLMNYGNIYEEKIDLEVLDLPDNLTLVEIQFPPAGTGFRAYINPESFNDQYFNIFLSVKLEAREDSGEGSFEIKIKVVTPENNEPRDGHKFVKSTITISAKGSVDPPPPPVNEKGDFPIAIFGGGLAAIVMVMGGAFYFLVWNKEEEEEEAGWGEGESWGADEWGDEAFDAGGAVEDYEAPLTTARRPAPSRAAPRAAPRPAAAPMTRPAGPAHVKCPKCKTGIKVSNPKRPLTIGCPKCSTKFTLKGKPGAAPAAPRAAPRPAAAPMPRTAGPAHVKCPKCKTGIKVSNPKRPLTIGCPKCSTKFTLKGKPGAAPAGPRAAPRPSTGAPKAKGPVLISCPKCSTKFKVTNPKRPLKVACPKCKTGLNLK